MRILALERIVSNHDSYGWRNQHNTYAYKPMNDRWQLLLWDVDVLFGGGPGAIASNDDFFSEVSTKEPVLYRMMTHPPFERAYWRALEDGANGPMLNTKIETVMDAILAALTANGVNPPTSTAAAKTWISSRRNFILQQVATINATFEITSNNGNNFTTSQNPYSLIGNAPVSVTTDQSERNTLSGDVGFPGSECYAQKTGEVDNFSAVERRGQLAQCPGLRPP